MSGVSRSEPLVVTTNSWRRLSDHKPPAKALCLVAREQVPPSGKAVSVQALRWNAVEGCWYAGALDAVMARAGDLWAIAPKPDLEIWDRAARPPAAEPAPPSSSDVKVITLEWSEPSPPTEDRPYDHVTAGCPLGEYHIEWKSWKDSPGFVVYLSEHYLGTYYDLEAAKAAAQSNLLGTVLDCLVGEREEAVPAQEELLPPPPTLEWLEPHYGEERDTFGYQAAFAFGGEYRIVWRRWEDDDLVLEWHHPNPIVPVQHLGTVINVHQGRERLQRDYEKRLAATAERDFRFRTYRDSV